VAAVVPGTWQAPVAPAIPGSAIDRVASGTWIGRANRLSPEHVAWDLIDEVAAACVKPVTLPVSKWPRAAGSPPQPRRAPVDTSAWTIIRQRRSAQAMDGRTSITSDRFFDMLARTVPAPGLAPWDALGPPVSIHLLIFVHRVEGLTPGLYCLARSIDQLEPLRTAMRADFAWEKPAACPDDLPLFLLLPCDCRQAAATVSCGQDIAGDGAFSLGMIADFAKGLREYGGWHYRRLFWETGMVGQVLYLEAEAAGVRGTGIGCFFDDGVHEIFGLSGHAYQSLYHFTVGGALEDARLTTLPPYGAERG
jgi:hypothetical protein